MVVVVNVGPRMGAQMAGQEVHELAKRGALLSVVMRPDGPKCQSSVIPQAQAEQVFKALRVEWIALHVEEQIARIRFWQAREAAAWFGSNQFEFILASLPFVFLKGGLSVQSLEDLRI